MHIEFTERLYFSGSLDCGVQVGFEVIVESC